jgi:hypothetical protein
MNENASEVTNSIKFVVDGEWMEASSDVPIDMISSSTEYGPVECGIAGRRRAAGGIPRLAGRAVQRVSVVAHCTEYFVGS